MFATNIFHPMIVHFPLALLLLGFLAEVISVFYKKDACLPRMGFYLLLTGSLGAIAAVLTGLLFTPDFTGEAGKLKATHKMFGLITTGLALVTSLFYIYIIRKGKVSPELQKIALALYTLTAMSVAVTGFFGGNLVYGT